MHDRRAAYVDNHDGDTVTMVLDQGFYDTKQINIRLANVWAPEMKDPGGPEVKKFMDDWFAAKISDKTRWTFLVFTYRTKTDREVKTFDRYVADVTSLDGKEHLNSDVMKYIIDKGYGGGTGSPGKK